MASEPIAVSTSEQGLRERIHRIFVGDCSRATSDSPHFWVEPTEAQKGTRVLEFHDSIQVDDDVQIDDMTGETAEERSWLAAPHAGLGGQSPEKLLTGNEYDRAVLEEFITVFEEGSFT